MPIPIDHRDITLGSGGGEPTPQTAHVHFDGGTNIPGAEVRVTVDATSVGETSKHQVVVADRDGNQLASISWTIEFSTNGLPWEVSQQVQYPASEEEPRVVVGSKTWGSDFGGAGLVRVELGGDASSGCGLVIRNATPPFAIEVTQDSQLIFEATFDARVEDELERLRLNRVALRRANG